MPQTLNYHPLFDVTFSLIHIHSTNTHLSLSKRRRKQTLNGRKTMKNDFDETP